MYGKHYKVQSRNWNSKMLSEVQIDAVHVGDRRLEPAVPGRTPAGPQSGAWKTRLFRKLSLYQA